LVLFTGRSIGQPGAAAPSTALLARSVQNQAYVLAYIDGFMVIGLAVTQICKLPQTEAIPILKNQWVLTWTLGKEQDIAYKTPTVVLTYVGTDAPFNSTVEYGAVAKTRPQARPSSDFIDDDSNNGEAGPVVVPRPQIPNPVPWVGRASTPESQNAEP
jgi:hypothetical protein